MHSHPLIRIVILAIQVVITLPITLSMVGPFRGSCPVSIRVFKYLYNQILHGMRYPVFQ